MDNLEFEEKLKIKQFLEKATETCGFCNYSAITRS